MKKVLLVTSVTLLGIGSLEHIRSNTPENYYLLVIGIVTQAIWIVWRYFSIEIQTVEKGMAGPIPDLWGIGWAIVSGIMMMVSMITHRHHYEISMFFLAIGILAALIYAHSMTSWVRDEERRIARGPEDLSVYADQFQPPPDGGETDESPVPANPSAPTLEPAAVTAEKGGEK